MMNVTLVDSLLTICTRYTVENIDKTLLNQEKLLHPGITLPTEISENILAFADSKAFLSGNIRAVFKDTTRTRLQVLHLRNCEELSDDTFEVLMTHYPVEIDIHNCPKLTVLSLHTLNKYGKNLKEIFVGNSIQIFPETLSFSYPSGGFVSRKLLQTPNVYKLVIWGLNLSPNEDEEDYWKCLTGEFIENLQYLDLSGCVEIEDFSFLEKAKKLRFLSVYNAPIKGKANWNIFKGLAELRHLDISQSSENASVFREANALLSSLVESLPHLTSLDISGTNLGGRGVAELVNQPNADELSDIPGLNCRVNSPLEFLGLYGTHHDASHRHHIPAKKITGDKDEAQILQACQAYMDRHEVLEKVLNDLFHLFRAEKATEIYRSLNLILQAMNRHVGEKHVQISGSASLFYLVKNQDKNNICLKLKRDILTTLVNAMDVHKFDATMMRNGCLTICHFKIPHDVMFKYEKLVSILLEILCSSHATQEDFVERIAIYLLNSLACQVEGSHKRLVGQLGAIQKMLQLIDDRLNKQDCDDVMEIAWSTMWNVTDETPENCERFLEGRGMELFLNCLNQFPNKPELLRNMMGLLGNVAEVSYLRPQLMTSEFITVFYTLLDSTQDNIEVSYNAAGVLAHILSDGNEKWTISSPTRQQILDNMTRNINRWNINSNRNINYRSFEPILRLLKVFHTMECQLWAAWALANLTRVYPEKYVPLLEKENGLDYLSNLVKDDSDLSRYAKLTFDHVRIFNENGKIDLESFMEG